jgi:hypothetical protein
MRKTRVLTATLIAALITASIISSLFLLSRVGETSQGRENESGNAQWTTFFWFCGDGNLGEINMMLCNLHFLEMVEDSDEVNLVGILDKEEQGDTRLLEIHRNGSRELNLTEIDPEWTEGELDLGDPEPLKKFVAWGIEHYPAEKYNIHLVNHGGGWRGMCWDESSDDHLSLPEIRDVCEDFKYHRGRNLDILSTEGCLVGMIEFAYEIRNCCDYFVGGSTYGWGAEAEPESDTWEPGNWNYDTCWQGLVDDPNMSPEEFALLMGETFQPWGPWRAPPSIPKEGYSDVMGVYNLSGVEALADAVDALASHLISGMNGFGQSVNQAVLINTVIGHPELPDDLNTESFSAQMDWIGVATYTNYDLYDFAYMLTKISAGALRTDLAEDVMDGVEDVIMACRNVDDTGGHPDAHGVSIYIPYRSTTYDPEYEEIRFSQDTSWDEFLKAVQWT